MYKTEDSAFRALRANYGWHNRPTQQTIFYTEKKFKKTGSVTDCKAENIAVVAQSVEEDPDQFHDVLKIWDCLTAHCGEFYIYSRNIRKLSD